LGDGWRRVLVAGSSRVLSGVAEADAVKDDLDEAQAVATMRTRRLGDRVGGGHPGRVENARRRRDRVPEGGGVVGRDERSYVVERDGALRLRKP
jgi:hypothetical protein